MEIANTSSSVSTAPTQYGAQPNKLSFTSPEMSFEDLKMSFIGGV